MATMKKSQRNGHVGEASAFLKLCEWGCSANYLTQSDFGLDIHVQIPCLDAKSIPFISSEEEPIHGEWNLDSKFVHLQVKYRASGIWTPNAKNDRERLDDWVALDKSGIPVFLVLVKKNATNIVSNMPMRR